MTIETVRIGEYLIRRLGEYGVRHVFGVPGDFVLGFYDLLVKSELTVVNTCDEQGAGFAADAYARVGGLGVVVVTYGVGGLKVSNTTGQAYAEESPVIVISGAPGLTEQRRHPLLHHKVRAFDTQLEVFRELTEAATILDDPETACREIDRVLDAAVRHKRPGYIELPRDMVTAEAHYLGPPRVVAEESDPAFLQAALDEATARIATARQPVVILGMEVHRFGLREAALRLIEQANLPTAVTLLGKSVIGEQHPCFVGVYAGAMSRQEVHEYVEASDCLVLLGVLFTDIDLGGFTARLEPSRSIHATHDKISVGYHTFEDVTFPDFVGGLASADLPRRDPTGIPRFAPLAPAAAPSATPVTSDYLFRRLAAFLTDETIVIAEPGDALFGAEDLPVHRSAEFLSPAYYASLGFAVPASIGAQLADPSLRPLVLVGDGAFQMTGMELSTAVRYGLNPIVVVLNNAGYVTERYILDGPFNDVLPWDFSRIPDVLGHGRGFVVKTEADLDRALTEAAAHTDSFCLLDVRLDTMDASPALRRLAARLRPS